MVKSSLREQSLENKASGVQERLACFALQAARADLEGRFGDLPAPTHFCQTAFPKNWRYSSSSGKDCVSGWKRLIRSHVVHYYATESNELQVVKETTP